MLSLARLLAAALALTACSDDAPMSVADADAALDSGALDTSPASDSRPPLDTAPPPDASRAGFIPFEADCDVPAPPDPADINLAVDVEYTVAGGEPLRLDVAWPLVGGPHPLVVMIHGGGWVRGDKADERARNVIVRLAAAGYTSASINYRLADEGRNLFPAQVEDARCAVRWLRANAATYAADPTRVAAIGASAGGHLALMLSTAADVDGLDGDCTETEPATVLGTASFYGPADLRSLGDSGPLAVSLVEALLGDSPENVPDAARLASPIVHVDGGDPPHLLVQGGRDTLVHAEQSRALSAAFEAADVPATYLELADQPHAFELLDEDPALRVSTCTTLAFLEAVVGG